MVRDITYKDKNKREENLNVIIAETDRLNALVGDILTLSKLQANSDTLEIETFDLNTEINELIKRYDYLKKDPDKVEDYLRLGALLQGNYLSLFGKYGSGAKKTLKYYIKKGYITFFGSDIHRSTDDFKCERFEKKLYKLVKKNQKLFEDLTYGNITKIIENKEIDRSY
jgi:tyrosine-protein phosphatase YwqE